MRIMEDRYVTLPPELITVIGRHFRESSSASVQEIQRLAEIHNGEAVSISEDDVALVPEVFDKHQGPFFRRLSESQLGRFRFIIYDLLPFTHPEYFIPEMPLVLAEYYQTVRRAPFCGFISEYTRDIFFRRLKRTNESGGVVLPLGTDSLGPRATHAALNRPLTFTVLGTIEPRKNHPLILEAFEPLLRQIKGLELSFIGKMGWVNSDFAEKVRALTSDSGSGFKFFSAPDDVSIRAYIERSRATIYVSAAEGYGLPPVESLWVGTPVIASTTVPSLERLGTQGIHYVEPLNVVNLRRAVLAFLDDEYANRKTQETESLKLPTWESFTSQVLAWCTSQ